MSIMGLGRANGNGNGNGAGNGKFGRHVEPTAPSFPQPRPLAVRTADAKTDQLQLGHVTLEEVDRLTGMTADEIERVAEQVLVGAEETATLLRDLARRVRENGLFANERLARFVRVANECADIARSMRQNVEQRDELVSLVPKKSAARAEQELGAAKLDGEPALTAQDEDAADSPVEAAPNPSRSAPGEC